MRTLTSCLGIGGEQQRTNCTIARTIIADNQSSPAEALLFYFERKSFDIDDETTAASFHPCPSKILHSVMSKELGHMVRQQPREGQYHKILKKLVAGRQCFKFERC